MVIIYIYPDGTAESARVLNPVTADSGSTEKTNRAYCVISFDEYSGDVKVLKSRHTSNAINTVPPSEKTLKSMNIGPIL